MARPTLAPQLPDLFASEPQTEHLVAALVRISAASVGVAPEGKYRHWDTLRHLRPPAELTHQEWWFAVKLARRPSLRSLPLTDADGAAFSYATPDEALELLHEIDQRASGEISTPEVVTADHAARGRYLVNSLIEEAVRSSQLEGASTTRRVAKEMIRSGRPPRDRSEKMIVNNVRGLEFIREHVASKLTSALVLELHRTLTDGTLDDPGAAGRLQRPQDDRVRVRDHATGEIVHEPPPADQLEARLAAMCRFANGSERSSGFLHPVVRAVLVHFWLAYDHPFEDGNGRTARALFYWSMLSQGYWLTEYLSISSILRKAPAQYGRSFLYTETDGGDTTYFVLYHLQVIARAIEELHAYLRRKVQDTQAIERVITNSGAFNHRQLALLGNALRHPDAQYSFSSHARSHHVSQQTARNDLLDLHQRDLMVQRRSGRRFVFQPPPDLNERLSSSEPSGR